MVSYKRPRIMEFVDQLPKTISGKIRRVQLRRLEKERRERGRRERPSTSRRNSSPSENNTNKIEVNMA